MPSQASYDIFETLFGTHEVVWLGVAHGSKELRRKLRHYAKISSRDEIVAIDTQTHEVVARVNVPKGAPLPQKRTEMTQSEQ